MRKKKVTHIIVGLGGGGAEAMLFKLLQNMDRNKFDNQVVSMTDMGRYGALIKDELSIPVYTLQMERDGKYFRALKAILKCIKLCKDTDVIHSWMYHANLIAFIVAKILRVRLVWGLHHSDLSLEKNKTRTIKIAKIGAILSKYVDKVISCGTKVKETHVKIGFKSKNHEVIPNGIDTTIFTPNRSKKANIGEYLVKKIDGDKKVIINVARWDPLKDHENLIASISYLQKLRDDFIVILVGQDIDSSNEELTTLINKYRVTDSIILLGRREDVPTLMAYADYYVSSSSGEGFPNVIGEAMACETLCIVTDAGDSAYIVGSCGFVVPIEDAKELGLVLNKALDIEEEEYRKVVRKARERVMQEFDIINVTRMHEDVYDRLIH